jgi:hypothetical protein
MAAADAVRRAAVEGSFCFLSSKYAGAKGDGLKASPKSIRHERPRACGGGSVRVVYSSLDGCMYSLRACWLWRRG